MGTQAWHPKSSGTLGAGGGGGRLPRWEQKSQEEEP